MKIRVLHAGDWHPRVNGAYAGKVLLDPQTGYSVAFTDFGKTLDAILEWEKANPCDLAVFPGDIFDTCKPTPAEYAVVSDFLLKLLQRMPAIMISGNHDMDVNSMTATALEPIKKLAASYRRSSPDYQLHVWTEPTREIIQTSKGAVCVAGLPYPSKGRFMASDDSKPGDGPEIVMQRMNQAISDLVKGMNGGMSADHINIMLAHGTTRTATVGEQPRSIAHDLMIPVSDMGLYDFVALGHIHQYQQVSRNAFYSGSLLCSSFGEMHEIKGWCVAEVERGKDPVVQHIGNHHSREFVDISLSAAMDFNRGVFGDTHTFSQKAVFRVQGEVLESEYHEACQAIAQFEKAFPFTQNNLEIVRAEDRVRDSEMTAMLSEDEAVRRVVSTIAAEGTVSDVMVKHLEIAEEVNQ